jgi:hypothetical protein
MSRQISTPQKAVELSGQYLSMFQNSYINLFFFVFLDSISLKFASKNLLPLVAVGAESYLPPHVVRYHHDFEGQVRKPELSIFLHPFLYDT